MFTYYNSIVNTFFILSQSNLSLFLNYILLSTVEIQLWFLLLCITINYDLSVDWIYFIPDRITF